MTHLRVLLIAADPLARSALANLLAEACHVVGRNDGAGDWQETLDQHTSDVIVCDLGWQGDLVLPDLRELGVGVVVLAGDEESAENAHQAGAQAILKRSAPEQQLLSAIQATANDLYTFDPDYVPQFTLIPSFNPPPLLTNRENDVLQLLAQGLTNRAIAYQLDISDHTVKFHVNALLTKLGAQSRTEAAVKATRLGLLIL